MGNSVKYSRKKAAVVRGMALRPSGIAQQLFLVWEQPAMPTAVLVKEKSINVLCRMQLFGSDYNRQSSYLVCCLWKVFVEFVPSFSTAFLGGLITFNEGNLRHEIIGKMWTIWIRLDRTQPALVSLSSTANTEFEAGAGHGM